MGTGIYRLWASIAKPGWVNWVLLPGTVVSEMGYIFGCLITGGEIRRAKIMPDTKEGSNGDGEPTTEMTKGMKYVGPVVASLVSILACVACILAVHAALGAPVIEKFLKADGQLPLASLPQRLPTTWDVLWDQVSRQVHLLRRMCETWTRIDWLDWRTPLFVYFSMCLAVRLSPTHRPMRPTLAATATTAVVIALLGLIWARFSTLIRDVWPLLTYLWANLLFLLVVTLLLLGFVSLIRIFAGKESS